MHWWEIESNWWPAGKGLEISGHVGEYYQIKLHISNVNTLPKTIFALIERYGSYGCCGQKITSSTLSPCRCGECGVEIDGWVYYWISFTGINLDTQWDTFTSARKEIKKLYDREKDLRRRERETNAEGFHTDEQVAALWDIQEGRCYYCGDPLRSPGSKNPFHKDHIIPLVEKGTNWIENIALACCRCNSLKSSLDVIAFKNELGTFIGVERVESRAKEVANHFKIKQMLRKQNT